MSLAVSLQHRLDALRKKCSIGYGCGASCIPLDKQCRVTPMSAVSQQRLKRLMNLAAGGLRAEHVPYRGGAPLVEALTKGEIQYAWEPLGSLTAAVRDGLFRCIGMGTATRHPLFPDVPTMQEAGLAGFEAGDEGGCCGHEGANVSGLRLSDSALTLPL